MKKMLYFMAAALPAMLLINASNAEAQRKNHTRADVPAAGMQESEKMMNYGINCQCTETSDASCKCGKMSKKDMKKKHKKYHDRLRMDIIYNHCGVYRSTDSGDVVQVSYLSYGDGSY